MLKNAAYLVGKTDNNDDFHNLFNLTVNKMNRSAYIDDNIISLDT